MYACQRAAHGAKAAAVDQVKVAEDRAPENGNVTGDVKRGDRHERRPNAPEACRVVLAATDRPVDDDEARYQADRQVAK